VGVKCSKAIIRSEITRGLGVSENLLPWKGGGQNDYGSAQTEVTRLDVERADFGGSLKDAQIYTGLRPIVFLHCCI